MWFLSNSIGNLPCVAQTLKAVGEGNSPAALFGLPEVGKMALVDKIVKSTDKKVWIITETQSDAVRFYEGFSAFNKKSVCLFARDFNLLHTASFSREYEHKRITSLWKILNGNFDTVFTDIEAFTQKCVSPEALKNGATELCVGDELNTEEFCHHLVKIGYESTGQVDGVGQFSKRGGIIDIFTPGEEKPVRIEMWGDEVDTICYFDPETQRRTENTEKITLLPAAEFSATPEELIKVLESIIEDKRVKSEEYKDSVSRDIDTLKSSVTISADRYMNRLGKASFARDYIDNAVVLFDNTKNILSRLKALEQTRTAELSDVIESGLVASNDSFFADKSHLEKWITELPTIYTDSFTVSGYPIPPKSVAAAAVSQLSPWSGSMDVLLDDINPALKRGNTVVIMATGEKGANILISQLEANGITASLVSPDDIFSGKGVYVMPYTLPFGLEIPEEKLTVITHKPLSLSKSKKKRKNRAEAFNSLEELKVGDYVVHYSHGIGQFDGIHRIETGNVAKDYIKIKYKGTDVLYVPVTQLDMVSRYIGAAGENGPVLHRLGGAEWQRTKTRVKAAVKDMAKQLIKLYGERLKTKGFAFSPDGELQKDFEARFPFEETDDQLRAIDEIKGDMESTVPMDRLLCGDVGFGKTEVALRAAFKCICEGKQCALLVPTTILAWQHFLTATERFGELPIRVEMLSRFKTKGQITKIIKDLKRGEVDMVIGTHRLISDDVKFKDLGLVIIDEEQRFGVAQKEKLKTAFTKVDVLTLTATPIPRTLNMAMSGIRDMSSIEEAPQDRQPVQTYVMEQNNGVLLEAIRKELRRGGQVYYMHNRVESITGTAARLKAVLPEYNIGIAHGKMSEEELSLVWKELLDGEIDVLVCTTIIETGVDVPNANTLIIEDADKMGLAQLHQIRGRVGRSNRRAYAYFCFKYGKALSEIATKRLEAIREYTAFGSGFKIAMRDLEIRGAGNILGGEQHGHMEAVGYDMYIKLLGEAVDEEKGEKTKPAYSECSVDLEINANIPESYIPNLSHRLEMYRKIADIKTNDDKSEVIDEFCDRFGEPPKEVMGLIDIALLKGAAQRNGITEISGDRGEIRFFVKDFTPELAGALMPKIGNGVRLVTSDPVHFSVKLPMGKDAVSLLRDISGRL
ncbi:MAG: transcription-repair coupling factor [Clostridia bacterium]|nr:transcription-repair coupling factor [Clostridia bacterium]